MSAAERERKALDVLAGHVPRVTPEETKRMDRMQEDPSRRFVQRFLDAKGISRHPLLETLLIEFMTYAVGDYNRLTNMLLDALTQQRVVYFGKALELANLDINYAGKGTGKDRNPDDTKGNQQ